MVFLDKFQTARLETNVGVVVGDFKAAVSKAVAKVMPQVGMWALWGCVFHWGQIVWCHVQELGLLMC
jgi:hypothetical protein